MAEKLGLRADGKVYHLHPVGLVGSFGVVSDDNDLAWLKVPFGQLTFDVEGNDIEDESNPLHRYFSRIAHWPGGASGITIGRGYDLGQRPEPDADLRAAGVKELLLSWLVGAKGLRGERAKTYIEQAGAKIRKQTITRKTQYDLFLPIYDAMKREVIRISGTQNNRDEFGHLRWDVTEFKIQDIMVDLIYRGDYHNGSRPYIQKPFIENDLLTVIQIMSDRNKWRSVPEDRFLRRQQYLNK